MKWVESKGTQVRIVPYDSASFPWQVQMLVWEDQWRWFGTRKIQVWKRVDIAETLEKAQKVGERVALSPYHLVQEEENAGS